MLTIPPLELLRPRSLAEALEALSVGGVLVAGGTDVVPNLKRGVLESARLVSLRRVPELAGIGVDEDGRLVVGAGTVLTDVARDPRVRAEWSALSTAASLVASPAIRNVGTLGGNVLLDTRCAFYDQSAFWRGALGHCLKTTGDGCHVVPGGRRCVAAFSADTPPVLIAYGATARLASPRGDRVVPLEDLYAADGAEHRRLGPDEVLVEVRVPRPTPGSRAAYVKVRERAAIDFPALSIALVVVLVDRVLRRVSLVVGALGARPKVVDGLENVVGQRLDEALVEAIAARAHAACHPLDNVDMVAAWRRTVLPVHVRRMLRSLAGPI